MHATYNESITRFLNVFEEVNNEIPFGGLRWFFDHAETISKENIQRVKVLGGGIAIQDRLAFQGEYFMERYGKEASENSPPIKKIIEMGVPVGAGTDATRVSTYNPWISLYWLVSGKSVGGTILRSKKNCLDRMEALRLYTLGSAWFSDEQDKKGSIEVGKFADLAVLSDDYFSIDEEKIRNIQSILTIVGGKIVYATNDFQNLAPQSLPIKPSWSPVATYGGYYNIPNNVNFTSKDNYSESEIPGKNTGEKEKINVKELAISSNTQQQPESNKQFNYQIDKGIKLSSSFTPKVDKNPNKHNNISNMQKGLCPCCDDFFSF